MSGAPDSTPRVEVSAAMQRAVAFVESAGNQVARARARALIGEQPVSAVVELLRAVGAEDAPGESLRPSDPEPSVSRSMHALAILDELRCTNADLVERACASLAAEQAEDGSWCDETEASEDARIAATGMIAGYLAKTPFVRESVLASAADYLAARWDPDRIKGDAWEVNAAYFHCFALVRHAEADAILQWCGRELERGYRTRVYDAVRTARVFALCRAHALPGAKLGASELIPRMLDEQMDDGGYALAGNTAPAARVAQTLHALVGLDRLG